MCICTCAGSDGAVIFRFLLKGTPDKETNRALSIVIGGWVGVGGLTAFLLKVSSRSSLSKINVWNWETWPLVLLFYFESGSLCQ